MKDVDIDILNGGGGHSELVDVLIENDFDPGCLRPWRGENGRAYITLNGRDKKPTVRPAPVRNANSVLRKDEWIDLDRVVLKAARHEMRAYADLRAANTYSITNGMGSTVLQYQTESEIGDATISMDGLKDGENERLVYDLRSLPLPMVSKNFSFSAREMSTSRRYGQPIDYSMGEKASRMVGETVEKMTLGTLGTYAYGGGTIYGYTNFQQRLTYAVDDPDGGSWTGQKLVQNILAMKQLSVNNRYGGPFALYFSGDWDEFLDDDYSTTKGTISLRQRIAQIADITSIRTLRFLSDYQILLVQMTSDVARAVSGMEVTTVQWDSHGGLKKNFKVMCIQVPQFRYDFYNRTGIVHGAVA